MKSQNDFSVEKKIQISTSPSELISISSDFFLNTAITIRNKKNYYFPLSLLRFSDFDYLVCWRHKTVTIIIFWLVAHFFGLPITVEDRRPERIIELYIVVIKILNKPKVMESHKKNCRKQNARHYLFVRPKTFLTRMYYSHKY